MNDRVFLALPRSGQVEPESRLSAYVTCTQSKQFQLGVDDEMSSALTLNFNTMWSKFLSSYYQYFAMLHADVYPNGPWIDILAECLRLHNGDIVHAVCAIKDERGLTSTAIGDPVDPWRPVRRISMQEVVNLPPVFALEDLGLLLYKGDRCLLPNTGCMLIKRGEWCNNFCFTVQNRIICTDGKYKAQFEPEDWNLGRYAHSKGLRVLGTTLVKTQHYGRAAFDNHTSWGNWKYDEAAASEM